MGGSSIPRSRCACFGVVTQYQPEDENDQPNRVPHMMSAAKGDNDGVPGLSVGSRSHTRRPKHKNASKTH